MPSKQEMQRAIDELVAVNEALAAKLAEVIADQEETVRSLIEVAEQRGNANAQLSTTLAASEKNLKLAEGLLDTVASQRDEALHERNDARKEVEDLRSQRMSLNMALHGMEVERDQARAHADAMRERAFPNGPEFPWERKVSTAPDVHMHYQPSFGR